jgi:hypothetical protein
MISGQTIEEIEALGWCYILGARMRTVEVRDDVLSRGGRYQVVHAKGVSSKDPSPLKVKEVDVGGHRYIVCLNDDQAKKDAGDREAILESLRQKLTQGDKALVGNKGYRKYLTGRGAGFAIDEEKVKFESRFDGKWVLRTNTHLPAADVALKYKELWQVEDIFRSTKSILETRPIYHKCDETIRGHVFCSFLALVLRKALMDRLIQRGDVLEWADIVRDLTGLEEIHVDQDNKRFLLRSQTTSACTKVFRRWAWPFHPRFDPSQRRRLLSTEASQHVCPPRHPVCSAKAWRTIANSLIRNGYSFQSVEEEPSSGGPVWRPERLRSIAG